MARRVESVLELRIVRAQWPVNQWPAALRGWPAAAQQRRREESGQAAQRVGQLKISTEAKRKEDTHNKFGDIYHLGYNV